MPKRVGDARPFLLDGAEHAADDDRSGLAVLERDEAAVHRPVRRRPGQQKGVRCQAEEGHGLPVLARRRALERRAVEQGERRREEDQGRAVEEGRAEGEGHGPGSGAGGGAQVARHEAGGGEHEQQREGGRGRHAAPQAAVPGRDMVVQQRGGDRGQREMVVLRGRAVFDPVQEHLPGMEHVGVDSLAGAVQRGGDVGQGPAEQRGCGEGGGPHTPPRIQMAWPYSSRRKPRLSVSPASRRASGSSSPVLALRWSMTAAGMAANSARMPS